MSHHMVFFSNTLIVQVRYSTIETKEVVHIGYKGFLFPHSYWGEGLGATLLLFQSYTKCINLVVLDLHPH
jgi:hypothetical protein